MNPSSLILFAAVCLAASFAAPAEKYTTRYDNIDLDEILRNDRLYKKYFECLTNVGKCTPDGKQLKDVLPDALASGCGKCSARQRAGSEKVIRYLIKTKPADFAALEKLYDPSGVYKKKYERDAKKLGIKV